MLGVPDPRILGISIKDEISRVRLGKVKELLLAANLSIADIVKKYDFPSESALSAQFRRKFNCTPNQFRHTR